MINIKTNLLFIFLLLSNTIFAFRNGELTRVHVTSLENGNIIKNANVSLEGYEIPPIIAKYNNEKKYYYFDSIPPGYNTVLVSHRRFNEKGFQDVKMLPEDIYLRLSGKVDVRYLFFPGSDDHENNIYVEDPYKIALDIFYKDCEAMINKIDSLSLVHALEIETVNPYNINRDFRYECKESTFSMQYPTPQGIGSDKLNDRPELITIFIRKKNGSKFKRYNDPVIMRLRLSNLNIQSILYIKFRGSKFSKYRKNRRADKINEVADSLKSKLILYRTNDTPNYVFLPILDSNQLKLETNFGSRTLDSYLLNNLGLGLGFVDQLEYFSFLQKVRVCLANNTFTFCN